MPPGVLSGSPADIYFCDFVFLEAVVHIRRGVICVCFVDVAACSCVFVCFRTSMICFLVFFDILSFFVVLIFFPDCSIENLCASAGTWTAPTTGENRGVNADGPMVRRSRQLAMQLPRQRRCSAQPSKIDARHVRESVVNVTPFEPQNPPLH